MVGVEVRWGTTGRHAHVVGYRVHHLKDVNTFISSTDQSHDACIQDGFAGAAQDFLVGNSSAHHAQRHAYQVAAMLDRPFHATGNVHRAAKAIPTDALDTHQGGLGRDARQ